jgi:dTDP-4-amino-4,6-dideoxygalactose transaminase
MIPFNKPHLTGRELDYIAHAHELGSLSGDGFYTRQCHAWIESQMGLGKALLTHSCTGALEIMPLLADIKPGDEIIMPSYTFVSTANAFVLRGAVPVFVDVRSDTFNLNEALIEEAITPNTRAIVPVHYGGVGCEMDTILEIAKRHSLWVFEDAAQGVMAKYRGRALGSIGHLGAFSFHETKNVIAGEGGALLINHPNFAHRAEVIREKGTNRSQFFRGQIDKYTWVDIGSSYLPGEVVAAFLYAQLQAAQTITNQRLAAWSRYHAMLESLELQGFLRRPIIPADCEHNGHMYYVITESLETRTKLITHLKQRNIMAVFHYIPLHSAPAGLKYGRYIGDMVETQHVSDTLLRLPLFTDITVAEQQKIISAILEFYGQ